MDEVNQATQKTFDSAKETKEQKEKQIRLICLAMANVPGVNDDTAAVVQRANTYYKFIKDGVA